VTFESSRAGRRAGVEARAAPGGARWGGARRGGCEGERRARQACMIPYGRPLSLLRASSESGAVRTEPTRSEASAPPALASHHHHLTSESRARSHTPSTELTRPPRSVETPAVRVARAVEAAEDRGGRPVAAGARRRCARCAGRQGCAHPDHQAHLWARCSHHVPACASLSSSSPPLVVLPPHRDETSLIRTAHCAGSLGRDPRRQVLARWRRPRVRFRRQDDPVVAGVRRLPEVRPLPLFSFPLLVHLQRTSS